MRRWSSGAVAVLTVVCAALAPSRAGADDAIVGRWSGTITQEGAEPFEARLTFLSPRGGVSRYPSYPCGGTLTGGPKASGYEFQEVINWGGLEEQQAGCVGGVVRITVKGDTMQFEWKTTYEGKEYSSSGELKREE